MSKGIDMGAEETRELYGLVRELQAQIAAQTAILERVEKDLAAKDGQIRELQLESARRKGIMAVIGILGSIFGTCAVWIVKHFWGGGN